MRIENHEVFVSHVVQGIAQPSAEAKYMDTKPNMKLQMKICGYGMFLKNCPINVMVTKSLPNPKLGVYKEYLGVNVSTSIEAIDKFLKIYNI